MADPSEPSSLQEELAAASDQSKEEKEFLNHAPSHLSLQQELSEAPDQTKEEKDLHLPPASSPLKAELTAASDLSKDEKIVPDLCQPENISQGQHSETQGSHEMEIGPQSEQSEHVVQTPRTEDKERMPENAAAQNMIENDADSPGGIADVSAYLLEGNCTLSERVKKIQTALSAVTKYSHCVTCLQDKKNQAPELVCRDCSLSFCFRCSGRHKSTLSSSEHTMVPIEEGHDTLSQPRALFCPLHKDAELGMFCRNCDVLVCRKCLVDQHLQCPGKVAMQEYASEEREVIKRCRVKYAQVMRFFSEQRQGAEGTLAALNSKKQNAQAEIRKFFSALIKACMDVEGSLLEELETVTDHMDLLTEQSSAWQVLQENTHELLDITDILHYLPNADFLPLMEASKASLSHALRSGESLAASCPPQMTMDLCLAQSSLRSVVKRIKEIGATALTVNTHRKLTLRQVSTMSFSAEDDKTDPLVTAMLLLTHNLLMTADFNNSCLKLFHKEKDGASWNLAEVLPLKWRPFSISKLSEKWVYLPKTKDPQDHGPGKLQDRSVTQFSPTELTTAVEASSGLADDHEGIIVRKQAGDGKEANDVTYVEIHLAVTSPFAGCFEIVVPISSQRKMRVVRAIDEEKGYWGLDVVTEHKLAVSTIASGRSYISLLDTTRKSTQCLELNSDTSLTPLVTSRHVLATSHSSILVGDHGKKAVIHASVDGNILFTFTGNGSQKVSRPEGMCLDRQGHVYVADSGDHSISVLTKGGHLYSRTGSQQSDLYSPQALCMDKNSGLYVANEGGKLLTVYEVFQEC